MKNYYYLLASCLFFSFQLYAQTFEWAASFSGSGYDHSSSITLDQNGNVYSTGYFFNTVDFDPDTSVFNLTSSSSSDIYISKLDTNGQLVWAKSFTGSGTFKRGQGITIDKNGNIYTTGRFSGKVDFNPSTAPADTFFHNVTGSSRAAFISKLDSNGNFIWAKIFTGNGTVEGNSIAVDDYGNVFTTGSFAGTVDFNPAQVTFNMSSAGASDMFVSKLDASGNFEWAKKISGTSIDDGKAIAVDQLGNVCIVADVLSQVVDVDPSLNVVNLSTNGGFDVFVIKLDSLGNYLWAKNFGGTGLDRPRAMVMDSVDNIYITGHYQGTSDFDPDTTTTYSMTSEGRDDIFMVKLDLLGNLIWAKSMGGEGIDRGNAIALDKIGNIYLSGEFNDKADFNPDSISFFNIAPWGGFDAFTAKYRNAGSLVWATAVGGDENDFATSVIADNHGNVYTTGKFIDSVDFNPFSGTHTISTNSGHADDIFIQKLGQCWLPSTELKDSLCIGDTLFVGTSSYMASGNYIDIIETSNGCDSVILTSLEIVDIDVSYDSSVSSSILKANQPAATYQWLDCNNGYAPIAGENSQSFNVQLNGDYAVEIALSTCVDTTACVKITTVGIEDKSPQDYFTIYPNPSHSSYIIQLPTEGIIEVFDLSGQLVFTDQLSAGKNVQNSSELGAGVYFLRFSNEKVSLVKRLVVME